ncbi:MAG: segregation ATPase FtsK/SpoIIIE, family, partial [Acidimicrobiaceae bacterium]|nr:segregation ATPase FtsK/SpoIIIE, family [Acidimicrobiaceae bacterium]
MELLLTVRYAAGRTDADGEDDLRSIDLALELDPLETVRVLREALLEEAARRNVPVPPSPALAISMDGGLRPVDDESTVRDAGLVSGQTVTVVARSWLPVDDADGPVSGESDGVHLDITSGPAAGRTVVLGVGEHSVGRDAACSVVLDDPTVSRQHLVIGVSPTLDVTVIPNPDASNRTFVAPAFVEGPTRIRPDEAIVIGSTQLVLRTGRLDSVGERDRLGQVSFNRLPYRRPLVRERTLEAIPHPPDLPGPRRFSLAMVFFPVVGAVAFVLFTRRPEFLFLAGLSPMMLVSNHFSEGRYSRKAYARDSSEFRERVETRAVEVDAALDEERRERMVASPDIPLLRRQAAGRLARLWERPHDAPDFLELRLGTGPQPSRVTSPIDPGGDPALRDEAVQRLAHHASLDHVPVRLPLNELGVVGTCGDPQHTRALAMALLVQAATLHSPEEVVIAAAIPG